MRATRDIDIAIPFTRLSDTVRSCVRHTLLLC